MDPADYTALTQVNDIAIAPDGERVAFVTAEFDGDADERRASVWTVPTDGSDSPHRLTRATDAGSPAWSPDGRYLACTATREEDVELAVQSDEDTPEDDDSDADSDGESPDSGGDDPETQVWVFDLDRGGDARQITTFDEGITDFDWGPNGDRMVVAARDPTEDQTEYIAQVEDDGPIEIERLQHKQNGTGYLDEVVTYLFIVDVETRESTRLDDANDRGYGRGSTGLQPAWGEDLIAYVSWDLDAVPNPDDTAVRDVFTIRPDGTDRSRVSGADLGISRPTWGPDGERLAFAGRDSENFYVPTELYVTDTDRESYSSVSASLDRTLGYSDIVWVEPTTIFATVGDQGQARLCRFSPDRDAPEMLYPDQSELATLAPGRGVAVADESVVVVRSKYDEGTDIFSFESTELDESATRLTTLNSALIDAHPQPDCRRLTVEATDGESVEAFVYTPADADLESDSHPLLLNIHGGPMAFDVPGWSFDETFWTNEGYVILEVNYRGSTSYGRDFCEALRGAWNGQEVEDLLACVDAVVERGWVDSDALCCTGFSQGGVNTGYLVATTDRFAAAAAEHGIYDIYSSFGTDDSHIWLTADNGVPWENAESYRSQSSITDVGEVSTPTLLTAGDTDWRCPPSQAEQFYVSLRKQGIDSKLVIYQNEHHAVSTPDRAIHRLTELRDWFESHR